MTEANYTEHSELPVAGAFIGRLKGRKSNPWHHMKPKEAIWDLFVYTTVCKFVHDFDRWRLAERGNLPPGARLCKNCQRIVAKSLMNDVPLRATVSGEEPEERDEKTQR